MREHVSLGALCDQGADISLRDLAKYTAALQEASRKEREVRLSDRIRTRSRATSKKHSRNNRLLLVYPFEANEATLTSATAGLKELGGDTLGVQTTRVAGVNPSSAALADQDVIGAHAQVKGGARTHFITIKQDDRRLLDPGEWLNDSLVDFWMTW